MFRSKLVSLVFVVSFVLACGGEQRQPAPATDAGGDASTGPDAANNTFSDEGTSVIFRPSGDGFFDVPLPSDTRLAEDGSFDLSGWDEVQEIELVQLWFDAVEELVRGWGLVSGVFMWFEDSIDPSTLPQALEESVDTTDGFPAVALVDVDPESPERGRLFPLYCSYRDEAGTKHPAHHLACRSPFGVVRRPNTQYAFVVTTAVKDVDGESIAPSAEMASLLAGIDVGDTTANAYVEAATELSQLGLELPQIAQLTLIKTGDPAARMRFVNDYYDSRPEPIRDETKQWEVFADYGDYLVLAGYYDVPNIQNGTKPYDAPPQGKLALNDEGEIQLVQNESIRFLVTIPRGPMPEGGWPVMIYMHGSGGTSLELLHRGERPSADVPAPLGSGPAATLASYQWAGFTADFPFHDSRFDPPDTSGLKLYNLLNNPRATVDNFVVSANEVTLHARLLAGLTIDPAIDSEGRLDAGDDPDGLIRFNTEQLGAMGQSMGSTLGIPAATVDETIDALVPSGAGGVLIEIASTSTKPLPLSVFLKPALRLGPDEEIDQFNIILHVIQYVWDFVDPVVHSRHVFLEPYEGIPPKHVYMPAGLADGYFTPEAQAGVTAGMGLELVGPILEPRILIAMDYQGVGAEDFPVSGNGPNGVTAGFTQHEPSVLDGHNVSFQLDDVKAIYGCFFKTLANGTPEIRSPENASVQSCPCRIVRSRRTGLVVRPT